MKRHNNIYGKICTMDNLILAHNRAKKGKAKQKGVINFCKNEAKNLGALRKELIENTYAISPYRVFTIKEPKLREISSLPYRDRIVQHAIMNQLEGIFTSVFTSDTYNCIKGRGIHSAARHLKLALKDKDNTRYCLKLDIAKFYPSINHDILLNLLKRKLKDHSLLWLLEHIIRSAPGLPIGSYLSQYLSNFYLTYFDHWIKETKQVKYYFRYADDIVILSNDKNYLHSLLVEIRDYLHLELALTVKDNYQVFPVSARSIDFLGYRFYHSHILLRKNIKKNFARAVANNANSMSIASFLGWAKHANARNLVKKLLQAS